MPFRIIGIFALPFLLLFLVSAMGEESTVRKETPVFTNQDIEKYKKPSDSKPLRVKTDRTAGKKERAEKIKEGFEKEYWCKKATDYRRRIEKAQDDVREVEKEISELQNTGPPTTAKKKKSAEEKIKKLQKGLERARKQLRFAERVLSDFEDEAHRKEIPPGWLRCQFE